MSEIIVVAGGKREVGTSFVSAISALAARRLGRQVLLIDAVEGEGTLHRMFGVVPNASVWALANPRTPAAAVGVRIDERLTLLPGATPDTDPCPEQGDMRQAILRRAIAEYPDVDTVIVDGGSILAVVRDATEAIDADLLLVTGAERLSLAATHAMAKALRMRHPGRRIAVIANRDVHGRATCELLSVAATRFLGASIDIAGPVPDDPSVHSALSAGFSLIDAAEDSIVTTAIADVLTARASARGGRREPATAAAGTAGLPVPSRGWS